MVNQGCPWRREAQPIAAGGAKRSRRRPAPPVKALRTEGSIETRTTLLLGAALDGGHKAPLGRRPLTRDADQITTNPEERALNKNNKIANLSKVGSCEHSGIGKVSFFAAETPSNSPKRSDLFRCQWAKWAAWSLQKN